MPKDFSRTRRVAQLLRRELAEAIFRHLDDPRVRQVTVTAVEVSKDLRHAKVFFTCLGGDAERQAALDALKRASGRLQHELSQHLSTKVTPRLRFEYDVSVERGRRLTALIDASVRRSGPHEEPPGD